MINVLTHFSPLLRFFFFLFSYLGFLLRTFTNHRTAEEGGGHFFNSSLPLSYARRLSFRNQQKKHKKMKWNMFLLLTLKYFDIYFWLINPRILVNLGPNLPNAIPHKKWSFPLIISLVNVTKSPFFCGFGHMYWRNP